jgi:hypothetical protein
MGCLNINIIINTADGQNNFVKAWINATPIACELLSDSAIYVTRELVGCAQAVCEATARKATHALLLLLHTVSHRRPCPRGKCRITEHYDNAAERPIEVVSDEAENRRGPLCNL